MIANKPIDNSSSTTLQAQIEFRERACEGHSIDFTIGCEHNCLYCHFSTYEKALRRRIDKNYHGEVLQLSISDLLKQDSYPPYIYLSWSSDPFAPKARELTHSVLEHLLPKGIRFLILTKGEIPDKTLELIKVFGNQISIQVGLTSLDNHRNGTLEPGATNVLNRLNLLSQLSSLKIAVLAARLDPIFPIIDDSDESLSDLLLRISQTGNRNIIASYIITSHYMTQRLAEVEGLQQSLSMLTEVTPSVNPTPVLSIPYQYKLERFNYISKKCIDLGMSFHVCACKDLRLNHTEISHSCHPLDNKNFIGNYSAHRSFVGSENAEQKIL